MCENKSPIIGNSPWIRLGRGRNELKAADNYVYIDVRTTWSKGAACLRGLSFRCAGNQGIGLDSHFGFPLVIFLAGELWRGQWFPNSDTASSISWLMTGPAEWRDGNGCDASGGLPLNNSPTNLATCHANDPHISIMLPTYIYFAGLISAFLSLLCQTAAGQCKFTVHEIDVSNISL